MVAIIKQNRIDVWRQITVWYSQSLSVKSPMVYIPNWYIEMPVNVNDNRAKAVLHIFVKCQTIAGNEWPCGNTAWPAIYDEDFYT